VLSVRQFFEELLEENTDAFLLWSFGEGHDDLDTAMDYLLAWNGRHEEKLKVTPKGKIALDAVRMIRLWRES
jgi:hypothetical protein